MILSCLALNLIQEKSSKEPSTPESETAQGTMDHEVIRDLRAMLQDLGFGGGGLGFIFPKP